MDKINSCFNYGNDGNEFHGCIICDSYKSKLRLFTNNKIGIANYAQTRFRINH